MPHRSNTPSPSSADLDRVAELFAQWQATRTFAPTPHELRKQAVALLARHPPGLVAHTLAVDDAVLAHWATRYAEAKTPTGATPGFVTLPAGEPALPPVRQPRPDTDTAWPELTIRWPSGAQLCARGALPPGALAAILDTLHTGAPEHPGQSA